MGKGKEYQKDEKPLHLWLADCTSLPGLQRSPLIAVVVMEEPY